MEPMRWESTDGDVVFGFMGLNDHTKLMVNKLHRAGISVHAWDDKIHPDLEIPMLSCAMELVFLSDIIFGYQPEKNGPQIDNMEMCCLPLPGKAFVLTGATDVNRIRNFKRFVLDVGASFMEMHTYSDTKVELLAICSGSLSLFYACQRCFDATNLPSRFFGPHAGQATRVYVALQVIAGVQMAGVSEAADLAAKCKVPISLLMRIVEKSSMRSDAITEMLQDISDRAPEAMKSTKSTKTLTDGMKLAVALGVKEDVQMYATWAAEKKFRSENTEDE